MFFRIITSRISKSSLLSYYINIRLSIICAKFEQKENKKIELDKDISQYFEKLRTVYYIHCNYSNYCITHFTHYSFH